MGLAPGVPSVNTPNAGQVGQSFQQLLTQLYGSTPQQLQQANTFLPQFTNTATNNLNTAAGGVLGTYLDTILPGLSQGNNSLTNANVGTVGAAGPAAASAIGGISPADMGINTLLGNTATTELEAGSALPANQVDQTLNTVNQNWASRGMGGQPGNELDAALNLYAGGNTQLQQAETAGENALSTGFNTVTSPALSLISPTLSTPTQGMDLTGANAGTVAAGSQGDLPSTSDIESLMNTVYNSQASANIGQANVQEAQNQEEGQFWSGVIGGGMSM